ncbi:beta-lactamase/transpeptidase-like protein [Dichomitus squalens]|nr:beta-lactamase/transpeptidase-like protein [Dichomitus squalens]
MWTPPSAVAIAAVSLLLGGHYSGYVHIPFFSSIADDETERFSCRPFLPNLFSDTPPTTAHPSVGSAAKKADKFFTQRFSQGDIDSLSIAVVTSNGILFEKNFGVTRGNETETSPPTTSHSQYRIASVSKLFTALEGLILEERGVIHWDDHVDKYFKDYQYRLDGLDPTLPVASRDKTPMTLYQLVTHTSGLGRDWPPGTVTGWPDSLFGGGPPPTNGNPFPSHQSLFDAIARHHLTSPPASYPAYSNTGTGLLGIALAAADSAAKGVSPAITYADLLQRDIFGPMGLNGSHFLTTDKNKHLVVVPSVGPEVADQDFLDAMNPAGGQFSSLSDLITVTQTLLNPKHPKSQISQYSRDKWLETVHAFEEDDWTEIGFIWEIIKQKDSNGRARKIYWKLGAMAGYHSAVAFHPGTGYGVVVLLGGRYPDAAKLAYDAFEIFQPSIDKALADLSTELYAGTWKTEDKSTEKKSTARIAVEKGTLYIEEFILQGSNALEKFGAPGRLALRSSMRRDELRIDTGLPGYNGKKHMGCYPYWNGQDIWGLRNNAAINAIYFTGSGNDRRLHVPSLSLVLKRV